MSNSLVDKINKLYDQRNEKISVWAQLPDGIQKAQLFKEACALDSEILVLTSQYDAFRAQKMKDQWESDNMIIMLECPGYECRMGDTGFIETELYRNYVPGKKKCERCGQPLRNKEDERLEAELFDLGIDI